MDRSSRSYRIPRREKHPTRVTRRRFVVLKLRQWDGGRTRASKSGASLVRSHPSSSTPPTPMVHIFCPKPVRVSSSHSHPRLSRSPSLSASHNKPNSATSPSPSHSRRLSPISHPQSKPSSPSNADLSPSDDREMLPATPPPSRLSPPFLDGLALDELLSILSCPLPSSPSPVSPYSSSGPAPILLPPSRTGSRTGARRSVGGGGRRRSTGQGDPRTRGASPTTPGIPIGGRCTSRAHFMTGFEGS